MNRVHQHRYNRQAARCSRQGAAAVEFAIVAIPLFLFIFVVVELTRGMMCVDSLEEAARAGCRVAILKGATVQDVTDEVDGLMQLAGVSKYAITIEPQPLNTVPTWTPITVSISASFKDASWLPLPKFLVQKQYSASCTLPREADVE